MGEIMVKYRVKNKKILFLFKNVRLMQYFACLIISEIN